MKYPAPLKGSLSYRIGSFSQFANAWIGFGASAGNRDQTFSARTWEGKIKGIWWCKIASWVIDRLFFWVDNHTEKSFYSDDEITYTELEIIEKD